MFIAEKKASRTSFGSFENPIHVPEDDDQPPLHQESPRQHRAAKRATASPSDSSQSPVDEEIASSQDPTRLRELLGGELSAVEGKMSRLQEGENLARRKREGLEKAEREELRRLMEIRGQLAALKKDEESVQGKASELGAKRQAAADEEERCRLQWKKLQKSKDRVAAELESAREALRAQQELDAAQQELAAKRQVLEEKKRAVSAAWLREGRLQKEREREEAERRAERERREKEQKVAEEQAEFEQREQERKAAEQAERERERAEWEAKCDRDAAKAREKQEQEAAAERERLQHEEQDQAGNPYDNLTPRQRQYEIVSLKVRLGMVIRRVGSREARQLLADNNLRKAYKLAAQSTHSDKGNIDEEAIKELNSLKT